MLIKIKIMPDNEITGDMGTCYIVTDHQGFIEALETITDYKVMACFLDANKHYYQELVKTPSHFDKEIDVTPSVMIAVKDYDMDIMDKIIDKTKVIVPTFKTDDIDENDQLREENQRLKEELTGSQNVQQ